MKIAELPSPQHYIDLAARHGHYCPMSTLGLRLGWAARHRLKKTLHSAEYFAQTCARDGIRLALDDCELQVKDLNQHLLRFSDDENVWEISLSSQTLELAATYRTLQTDAERDALLEHLRSSDEYSLFVIVHIGAVN